MFDVETITGLPALEALRGEWDALADRFASPMLRHAWCAAAAVTYGEELAVYAVRREGRLVAAAPMCVDRSGLVSRLRLLGHQEKEPEGLLYEDEAALAALCRALLAARRPVVFQRLSPASPEWRLLAAAAAEHGFTVLRPGTNATHLTILSRDATAFEEALGSKKRARLRRSRAGLEANGAVAFEVLRPAEHEVEPCLDELERVEAASWKLRSGSALVCKPAAAAFTREHTRRAAREGMVRFSVLRLDGAVVACQLDLEHGGRLWCQKIGYDERWGKYAPGILNMHEVLKWAADRGLCGFEHLGFAEPWQQRWPFEVQEYGTFRFYPRRAAGALALGADTAAFARHRMRARALTKARAAEKARAA